MNWQSQLEPGGGWSGRRKFAASDLANNQDAKLVVLPRLGGPAVLEQRTVELNDCCAEHTTPWWQLLFRFGSPASELRQELEEISRRWTVKDEPIGLFWKVVSFGESKFRNPIMAILSGDQPTYWIRVDFLSDRLLKENQAFEREQGRAPSAPAERETGAHDEAESESKHLITAV